MTYDTMKVMQYNIRYINIYEVKVESYYYNDLSPLVFPI